ncbi:MAG: nitrophenyl compound nitroreductase subunit ArsF family protein [Akkermansiaceae bacterium]|jgi:thiol-disulfide isomerase/thioredoxin|nr:nitrophenyl compound nitroreductase subunit ArsF family protein [Akkermansiaceae bacterium]
MIAKQVIRSLLLLVVLGSLAIRANREYQKSQAAERSAQSPPPVEVFPKVDGDQVVMTYFMMGTRCVSCRKIEALARETAEKDFAGQLASRQLVFRVVDCDEPANQHYLKDYKLTSKTVVISHRRDERETEWKNMDQVWDLLDEPAAFRAYLAEPIRQYLGS